MRVKEIVTNGDSALLLLGPGLVLVVLAAWYFASSSAFAPEMRPHPTDAELIENWTRNRKAFDELLRLFEGDQRLGRVAPDFIRPAKLEDAGVSRERIKDYQQRCRALRLEAGIEGYDEKSTIWFHASTRGLSVTGSSKGYAYVTRVPDLVVPSLDDYRSADGRSYTAYRHLEGDWYLYIAYED